MRKPTKSTLRRHADAMLQQYIKLTHEGEICMLCGERPITVAHHFIYKKQSNACRYYLPNLIPLCQNCHCLIHAQPSLTNAKVALHKGQAWIDDLETRKRAGEKFTLATAQYHYNEIRNLLDREENGR